MNEDLEKIETILRNIENSKHLTELMRDFGFILMVIGLKIMFKYQNNLNKIEEKENKS